MSRPFYRVAISALYTGERMIRTAEDPEAVRRAQDSNAGFLRVLTELHLTDELRAEVARELGRLPFVHLVGSEAAVKLAPRVMMMMAPVAA